MDIRHPGEMIKKILADYKSPKLEHLPPFTGGLWGILLMIIFAMRNLP